MGFGDQLYNQVMVEPGFVKGNTGSVLSTGQQRPLLGLGAISMSRLRYSLDERCLNYMTSRGRREVGVEYEALMPWQRQGIVVIDKATLAHHHS